MHVPTKAPSQYPWFVRLFFWKQKKTYGKILEPGMLWGRSPLMFSTVAMLYGAVNRKKSPLSHALRSLVTVRVSQLNHCEFCVDINAQTLLKRGVSEEKIESLFQWQNSNLFDGEERVALEFTEAMTLCDREVDAELIERLGKFYDHDGIVELAGVVAFQNLSSKFNAALDVPAQGFCQIPAMSSNKDKS